ncbi:hypothetical protein HPB48_003673 [Haemaphysalis longicornis]|uniref:Cyclin-like domain-containing protein n=1 Tax=Haemaphysalis longicornis TaxID=44386 RepID=A0A9J6F7E7_HAELO|nr:hypothetical protein HPB48_003673 [Haemaphysalis longicornis]
MPCGVVAYIYIYIFLFFVSAAVFCGPVRTLAACHSPQVYHLAGVRFQDICARLGIQQKDVQLKIWTCFEHSIVSHTDLMRDRHLDQLILCAVYVITKVTRVDKSFQEILHCYRQQPQNKSHDLRVINRMVQSSENVSKRILHEDDNSEDDSPAPKRYFFKKIQTVMKERQDVCAGGSTPDN